MKPSIVVLVTLVLCSYHKVKAQNDHYIYLIDETLLKVEVVGVTNKSIKFNNESNRITSSSINKILMAFNQVGDYIIFSNGVHDDPLIDFTANAQPHTIDFLVTMNSAILPVYIITTTDHEIIYENADDSRGEQAMSIDLLAAVIYKDGRHQLYVSPSQGAEILSAVQSDFNSLKSKAYEKTSPVETSPKAKPAPDKNIAAVQSETPDSGFVPVVPQQVQIKEDSKQLATSSKLSVNSSYFVINGKRRYVDLDGCHTKALAKTESLKKYISIIVNSQTSWVVANEAIDRACELFISENVTVETSAAEGGEKSVQPIRAYLNQLKQLKSGEYTQVEVTWVNIRYGDNPTKSDGVYSATITFKQTLKKLIDDKIARISVTEKRIKVVLVERTKMQNSLTTEELDVMLSDISMVETR